MVLTSSWLSDNSSESEISNFDASLVSHEEIRDFQVTVDNVASVKILQTAKHLKHDAFHLGLRERRRHVV